MTGQETGGAAPDDSADDQMMLDVVTTLTANARRVAVAAVEDARADGTDDLIGHVAGRLQTETEAIIAGIDPRNRPLVGAVSAAGRAIEAVAVQALRTGSQRPEESLDRAFELFDSYLRGPGRVQILSGPPGTDPALN